MSKIGFIGLGIMDAPMAEHLTNGGHELYDYDIGQVPHALLDKGATPRTTCQEVAAALHRHGMHAVTEHTIRSAELLCHELSIMRARGWAFDNEEHAVGLPCVAATLKDEHGDAIAAISISGPRSRLPDERVAEIGRLVAEAAGAVSKTLGGRA